MTTNFEWYYPRNRAEFACYADVPTPSSKKGTDDFSILWVGLKMVNGQRQTYDGSNTTDFTGIIFNETATKNLSGRGEWCMYVNRSATDFVRGQIPILVLASCTMNAGNCLCLHSGESICLHVSQKRDFPSFESSHHYVMHWNLASTH